MSNHFYKTAEVQRLSDKSIEVRRSFNASKDLVYKAQTTPALLKRWMLGPPGWQMPVCEMDLKAGGKYRWRWKNIEDQSEFGFFGVFREVHAAEKLVYSQKFDPGTLGGDMGGECVITVTFSEMAGKATMNTRIDYKSKEDLEKAVATGMTDGMEMSYAALDNILGT